MKKILILLLLLTGTVQAQEIKFAPNLSGQAVVSFVIDASGVIQIDRSASVTVISLSNIQNPGPNPGPVVNPPVVNTLGKLVKTSVNAIPEYANKDQHRRAIAFLFKTSVDMLPNSDINSAVVVTGLKETANQAFSADANKWSGFWDVVSANTSNMTITQFKVASADIISATASDLAGVDDPNMGLGGPFLEMLLQLLLPLLQKLLLQLLTTL